MSSPKAHKCLEVWYETVHECLSRIFSRSHPPYVVVDEPLEFLRNRNYSGKLSTARPARAI